MVRVFLAAFLFFTSAWAWALDEELLEPEQAFRFSASMVDASTLEARFQIAKGYYLYRDKIAISADGVKLGQARFPAGKVKQDEYFGRIETLSGDLRVRVPLLSAAKAPFTLKASYQGCAEAGVCYPPLISSLEIQPVAGLATAKENTSSGGGAVAASAAVTPAPLDSLRASGSAQVAASDDSARQDPALIDRLKSLAGFSGGGGDEQSFLSPDEAFQVSLKSAGGNSITADFVIAPKHYLYRDKIRFTVRTPDGGKVEGIVMPPAEEKDDPNFGKTFIYHNSFTLNGQLTGLPEGASQASVVVTYQGCSEMGICYPPSEKSYDLALSGATSVPAGVDTASAPADESESGQIAKLLKGGSYWLVIVTFFGFGLLLALTPCVFPMIPILSGIIVGHGQHVTKWRGFLLSLAYVLGMAVTYALAGVAAGLSGTLISNALQNPWTLGFGAGIFVALAFSMFGFYELQMPSFLQSRFTEASNRMKSGNFVGVFLMGAMSALIVGPCVAAPLAGALLYIGQSGDVVLGGVSLFSLAMGMGMPLLLVGVSAGALLPRAGAWMEAVKKFFGVLMIAIAIWLVSPLLPELAVMFLWAVLLIVSGVFLRAVDPLTANANGWTRFWKGAGIIALITGISLLLGALGGGRDVLQPLAVFKGGSAGVVEPSAHLSFQRMKSIAELDAAVKSAGKPVMLDFYADWCVSCKEMDRFTFTDPKVQAKLEGVLLLQVDVTNNTADDKALLKRFSLFGPPGMIFFDANGQEQGFRVVGYEPPEKFLQSLNKALP